MNSKEALERLIGNNVFISLGRTQGKKQFVNDINIIEKDLEILEILKTEIFNEHCFDLDAGWYDDSFSLNENQIKVIKEWLESE